MTFLDKYSLDRETRLKEKKRQLDRKERIAQLERDIKASEGRLSNGIPAPNANEQAPITHNYECHARYHKYGVNHFPTDGCQCHKDAPKV